MKSQLSQRSSSPRRPLSRRPKNGFLATAWEHILASVEEGIIVIDQVQQVVFLNPAAETLIGVSGAQAAGQPYTQLFARNPWLIAIIERTLVSGSSRTAGEGTLRNRHHRDSPVRLTCSPIFNTGTTFLGVIVVLHDLSYQKELAEDAQRADRLAHLGVVAAGLAHEIKNPLAGIRGAAQLLQNRLNQDPSVSEYTGVMIREIDRLSGLLEQLLQLSSPRRFEPQPVNVHKVLTNVLLLEREALPKSIEIQTHFDPSLPSVPGDERALAQVFRNLIKNGIQALEKHRHGLFILSTRMATNFHLMRHEQSGHPPGPANHKGRFLSIDFTDNGPGIAADHLPQLFTPFFTTKSKGTGLGLPISQQIIVQHGGTIRVESELGYGTSFHVYLPVSPS